MKWSATGTLIRLLILYPLYYAAALAVAMVVVAKLRDFSLKGALIAYVLVLAACLAVHYVTYARAIFRSAKSMMHSE